MDEKRFSFDSRENYYQCECGGQISFYAKGYQNLPIGFGFRERSSGYGFGIDCIRQQIIKGFCLKCGYSGVFIGKTDKKIYTKRVRKVDNAIRKARQEKAMSKTLAKILED